MSFITRQQQKKGYFKIGPSCNKQICWYVSYKHVYKQTYMEIAETESYKREFYCTSNFLLWELYEMLNFLIPCAGSAFLTRLGRAVMAEFAQSRLL